MLDNPVPVYLIGLTNGERLPITTRALTKCDIRPILVDAVAASDFIHGKPGAKRLDEFPQWRRVDFQNTIHSAQTDEWARAASLACYLSHIKCLRRISANGDPQALVVEDDVLLYPQINAVLRKLLRYQDLWDVLRFHFTSTPVAYGPKITRIKSDDHCPGGLTVHQYLGGHNGALALLYNREGVKKVLDMHDELNADFRLCFDDLFSKWYRRNLRYCFVRPTLAYQNPQFESTIYTGVGNARYDKNIYSWFTPRGRFKRARRRIAQVYTIRPWQLWIDFCLLSNIVGAAIRLYLGYRRHPHSFG